MSVVSALALLTILGPKAPVVDVEFTSPTSSPRDLFLVRGTVLRMRGIADKTVTTNFLVRIDGAVVASGEFSRTDEWRLQVPTAGVLKPRAVLTVGWSRAKGMEKQMARIDLEVVDKSPFSIADKGEEGPHRRRMALDNSSRLKPLVVRWASSSEKVRVAQQDDGTYLVDVSDARPGTYEVSATAACPSNLSFDADPVKVVVPERVAFKPEGPARISRDRATEKEPFRVPLGLGVPSLARVELLREGVPQEGALDREKGEFVLARDSVREGDASFVLRAVGDDGAVYWSNPRTLSVASAPEYLKHRVLLDGVALRDRLRRVTQDRIKEAVEAHEAVKDLATALEASRKWAIAAAAIREGRESASLPNPLGLTKEQGAGWRDGVSALFDNWTSYLSAWVEGTAAACEPIRFDRSPGVLARECQRRTDAIDRASGALRDAEREAQEVDRALIRLAVEAQDPPPAKVQPTDADPRLKLLSAQLSKQRGVLVWLGGLCSAVDQSARAGTSSAIRAAARRIGAMRGLPGTDPLERDMTESAIATYVHMAHAWADAHAAEEERQEILSKYVRYPGKITPEDRETMVALDRARDAANRAADRHHDQAFRFLSTALFRYHVPMQ